ncbi:MAG: DUF4352 domain-containing protein [Bifidobacteriaceae bacterium]|nr:DUF4352 domain-containing protein [Bifidobacteriaceae bacterium]
MIATIAAAVVALLAIPVAIIALTGGFTPEPTPEPGVEETAAPPQPSPGASGATEWMMGRTFDTGNFELEILAYQDGLPALSEDGSEISENGQWVLVELKVRNRGDTEGTFIPLQQVIVTEAGDTYANEPASALRHANSNLGATPIKPGESQTGFLAFDIPIDSRPTELRLTGRIDDPPVSVPLG